MTADDHLERRFQEWADASPVEVPPLQNPRARPPRRPLLLAAVAAVLVVAGGLVALARIDRPTEVSTQSRPDTDDTSATESAVPTDSTYHEIIRRTTSDGIAMSLSTSTTSGLLDRLHERWLAGAADRARLGLSDTDPCPPDVSFLVRAAVDGDEVAGLDPLEMYGRIKTASAPPAELFVSWAWTSDAYTELVYVVIVRAYDQAATSAEMVIDGQVVDAAALSNGWAVLGYRTPADSDELAPQPTGDVVLQTANGPRSISLASQPDPSHCPGGT